MSDESSLLVIAQCTKDKKEGYHPAKELYIPSRLFRAQRRYAEAHSDEWLILSAKHGLVTPETEILSYDETFDEEYHPPEPAKEAKKEFFKLMGKQSLLSQIDKQNDNMDIQGTDWHVELICGEKYASRVEWYLDRYNIPYSKPFEGQRYQERIANMNQAAREATNYSLDAYV